MQGFQKGNGSRSGGKRRKVTLTDIVYIITQRGGQKKRTMEEVWWGCMCLCSRITHLLCPGSTCVSVVSCRKKCVCWCEGRSLHVETRA